MITEIGIVAGDIWHYLDHHKTASLNELIKGIDKKRDVALMSLGWLAREGHVIMEDLGSDYKVTLRFLMPAIVVLTTVSNQKTASRLAQALVVQKLAACVSVLNKVQSTYYWKGRLERASESLLFIKTTQKKYTALESALKKIHPYEVPEILALPVLKGSREYLKWLGD